MPTATALIEFSLLGLLGAGWLLLSRYVMRLDAGQSFHLAANQRDRRKARFYFLSVNVGLTLALMSFLALDALSRMAFDSLTTQAWTLGVVRGVGLWGLIMTALVWTQVGQRVSQLNSDGKSRTPRAEDRQQPNLNRR